MAADGDQLTATFALTGPPFQLPLTVHTDTLVITITGGTGRFADASGTLTSSVQVSPELVGLTVHTRLEATIAGQISY